MVLPSIKEIDYDVNTSKITNDDNEAKIIDID